MRGLAPVSARYWGASADGTSCADTGRSQIRLTSSASTQPAFVDIPSQATDRLLTVVLPLVDRNMIILLSEQVEVFPVASLRRWNARLQLGRTAGDESASENENTPPATGSLVLGRLLLFSHFPLGPLQIRKPHGQLDEAAPPHGLFTHQADTE